MQCLGGLLRTKTRNYLFLNVVCHLCDTVLNYDGNSPAGMLLGIRVKEGMEDEWKRETK